MINDDIQRIIGATVHGSDGERIGEVGELYRDNDSGRPTWVTVNTGLFGTKQTFIPIDEAQESEAGGITVPFTKAQIKDAPRIDADGELTVEEEEHLYRYYGKQRPGLAPGVEDRDRDQDPGRDQDPATDRDQHPERDRDQHPERDRDRHPERDRDRDAEPDHDLGRLADKPGRKVTTETVRGDDGRLRRVTTVEEQLDHDDDGRPDPR